MIAESMSPRRQKSVRTGLVGAALAALTLLATGCFPTITYDLTPEEQRYELTLDQEMATSATVHTSWEFLSREVIEDDEPPGYVCFAVFYRVGGPCAAEPLIFLEYDFDLALDNTAQAGKKHEVTVTPYYQDPDNGFDIVELMASASFDGGETWHEVDVKERRDGMYNLRIDHPDYADTSGTVDLKVSAEDSGTNTVEQHIEGAYTLRQ